jgi:hypothetical protein
VHDAALLLLDGPLSGWGGPSILAGVIAFGFWLLERSISRADDRQKDSAAEVRKQGDKIVDHEVRITVIEKSDGRRVEPGGRR